MADDAYVLAVDIGTTATKALAVSAGGAVLAAAGADYPLLSPRPGAAELDPDAILAAVRETATAVRAAAPGRCAGVAFSAFMHGLFAVDDRGRPLQRCWTWADTRAAPQAAELHARGLAADLLARTGTPVHALSPLCKLRWMAVHDAATFGAAARFLSIKEYVLAALCGDGPVDHSIASATGLFALAAGDWDPAALQLAGVEPARLSALVPTRHRLAARPADALPVGVPVFVGASDGALANLGCGAVGAGVIAVTLGTSGAARAVVPAPMVDPHGRLFCYALTETEWVVGGALQNAGLVVQWLAQLLGVAGDQGARAALDPLVARAAAVPPGADGLLCLPLLAGERFAAWRPDDSAVFAGLTRGHGAGHVARAVLEGIACHVGVVVAAVEAATAVAREVRFGGGFAAVPWLRQLLADVLDRPVAMPSSAQASALGAARLAWRELGAAAAWRDDIAARHAPDPARAELYRALAARLGALYTCHRPLLGALAAARADDAGRV